MIHYLGIHLNSAAILSKKPGPPQCAHCVSLPQSVEYTLATCPFFRDHLRGSGSKSMTGQGRIPLGPRDALEGAHCGHSLYSPLPGSEVTCAVYGSTWRPSKPAAVESRISRQTNGSGSLDFACTNSAAPR